MKIAYLVLAHARPQQLGRMVAALPLDAPVFVHFDKRADPKVYAAAKHAVLKANPTATFVQRYRCRWGGAGIMYATLELIASACASGEDFDYATLLSGQDYPIKSHEAIAADLAGGGEFIECFPLLEPNRWSDHGGYFHASARMLGRYVRFRSHIRRIGSRKLPADVTPFGGSQWWTLSRRALDYVEAKRRDDRRFIRFLGNSFIPDECFMQTILGNSQFAANIVQDDLRFAIWNRPEPPFPAVLKRADLPMMAASNKHFARKFDHFSDPGLADEIDDACRVRLSVCHHRRSR